jgi:hypothetical protein
LKEENNNRSDTFPTEISTGLYNKAMLSARQSVYRLKRSQLKLLDLVSLLNEKDLMGSAEGLVGLVKGQLTPEVNAFKDAESFGSLTSYSPKRLKGLLRLLVQHGYLEQVYSAEEEDYFFRISPLGQAAVLTYRAHPHKKKSIIRPAPKKTIIPLIIKENTHE